VQLFHLHPMIVHFPIAFLMSGLVLQAATLRAPMPGSGQSSAAWIRWTGTAFLWMALATGLLAARTAPHVPPAWEVLAEHRTLGFWTAGMFTAASVLRRWLPRRRRLLLFVWTLAVGLLIATAWHGAELVYEHGISVVTP
jgi:uncharacterized membrane protein